MRILHTSDWHLGQSFFTKTRQHEHHAFLNWLLEQVKHHQIDAVIVAGDIFDTTSPPSYARSLYNQFIVRLKALQCPLIVVAGNHDSVAMLNESKQLLAELNTHVIANAQNPEDHLIELKNRHQDVIGIVCSIPFLRAKDIVKSQAGESIKDKKENLADAIKAHYQATHQVAVTLRGERNIPIIATGHLTAMGVTKSDSVRDIYIGNLSGFDASGFPPADYIALGHIHKAQKVAKKDHIRYCGSPIPLSFDELKSEKTVLVAEFEHAQLSAVTPLTVPRFQQLDSIKGNLAQVKEALTQYQNDDVTTWLSIEVQSEDYLSDLQNTIGEITEPFPIEVLQLRRARKNQTQAMQQQQKETLAELTPEQVFAKRLSLEQINDDDERSRLERIQTQFEHVLNVVKEQQS